MCHRERPQFKVGGIGPVQNRMQQHCTSPGTYGLNRPLRDSVLMLGSNAAERNCLPRGIQRLDKLFRLERVIVCAILLDKHAMLRCKPLELCLGCDGFAGAQRYLVSQMDVPSRMIDKYGSAIVLLVLFLFPFRVWESSQNRRRVLIDRHTVARLGGIML